MSEGYTVAHRLLGHESDVNGVEWSPDGRFLASSSLDGTVCIWQVQRGFALLKRIESDPRKPLKGLLWDPLGHFLGAQSNDGHVYIWRTSDWRLDAIISSPYGDVFESYTYFSRPSWSPDGQSICLPDALNASESVAILIERTGWMTRHNLVGHSSSVQVAVSLPPYHLRVPSPRGPAQALLERLSHPPLAPPLPRALITRASFGCGSI